MRDDTGPDDIDERASRRPHRLLPAAAQAAALALAALAAALHAANEATIEVAREAALQGDEGLRIRFDGRRGAGQRAFVVDETPAGETAYRAVFWFDPNGVTMKGGDSLVLFEGLVRNGAAGPQQVPAFRLHLRRAPRNAGPRLVGELFADDRSRTVTAGLPLAARGPRRVQVEWRAASAPGARDGLLRIALLGTDGRKVAASGAANASHRLLTVRLGVVGEVDAGSFGTLFVDGFESYRTLER